MLIKLLKAAWIRLRCALLNQPSEPYMESKIPLPTDNIYKFYALFALLLFVFSVGMLVFVGQSTNRLIFDSVIEKQQLLTESPENPISKKKIEVLDRELEIAITNRTVSFWFFCILSGFSLSLGAYGFRRWHQDIQPRIDEASRVQLEISKLQLAKLQAEMVQRESAVDRV